MFLANGFEETEALVTLDMLRRAEIDVKTVGIGSSDIVGTHNITVKADFSETEIDCSLCAGVILPGGMPGTENLYASETVKECVEHCVCQDKLLCAICAAPIILGRRGFLENKKAVCFPGFEDQLTDAEISSECCVKDGNIITAKGAGCVFEFSYEIISYIKSKAVADEIIRTIQHNGKLY